MSLVGIEIAESSINGRPTKAPSQSILRNNDACAAVSRMMPARTSQAPSENIVRMIKPNAGNADNICIVSVARWTVACRYVPLP